MSQSLILVDAVFLLYEGVSREGKKMERETIFGEGEFSQGQIC
jgi:hypothetical protein